MTALDAALTDIDRRAADVVAHMVRQRADFYRRRPQCLDTIMPDLSDAKPRALAAYLDSIIERESTTPRRLIGMGGEVPMLNLKAARLYAQQEMEQEMVP